MGPLASEAVRVKSSAPWSPSMTLGLPSVSAIPWVTPCPALCHVEDVVDRDEWCMGRDLLHIQRYRLAGGRRRESQGGRK